MFSVHRDEETKTALSKPTQTMLLQCGDRKSVLSLLLRLTRKEQPKMHRNRNATKRFKKQMDSKTKQEEDGFPRSKKLTRRVERAAATMEVVVVLALGVFPLSFVM
jgi:hypothetical protein